MASSSPGRWCRTARGDRRTSSSHATSIRPAADCHLRLGEHAEAVTKAREATSPQHEHGPRPVGRDRAGRGAQPAPLAAALAHTGELEETVRVAIATLQDYQGVAVALLRRRARDLEHDLTVVAPDSPHVREYAEVLHTHTGEAARPA